MKPPIRVGAVSYLNAKPLYYRLCEFAPGVRLSMDLPSRLAERLADGALDVALIPSVEYLRGAARGYEIMPGLRDRGAGAGAERQAVQPGAVGRDRAAGARRRVADEPGAGAGLARRRGMASGRGRIEELPLGVPVAGEHGRRRARDRRPGDEGPARAVP